MTESFIDTLPADLRQVLRSKRSFIVGDTHFVIEHADNLLRKYWFDVRLTEFGGRSYGFLTLVDPLRIKDESDGTPEMKKFCKPVWIKEFNRYGCFSEPYGLTVLPDQKVSWSSITKALDEFLIEDRRCDFKQPGVPFVKYAQVICMEQYHYEFSGMSEVLKRPFWLPPEPVYKLTAFDLLNHPCIVSEASLYQTLLCKPLKNLCYGSVLPRLIILDFYFDRLGVVEFCIEHDKSHTDLLYDIYCYTALGFLNHRRDDDSLGIIESWKRIGRHRRYTAEHEEIMRDIETIIRLPEQKFFVLLKYVDCQTDAMRIFRSLMNDRIQSWNEVRLNGLDWFNEIRDNLGDVIKDLQQEIPQKLDFESDGVSCRVDISSLTEKSIVGRTPLTEDQVARLPEDLRVYAYRDQVIKTPYEILKVGGPILQSERVMVHSNTEQVFLVDILYLSIVDDIEDDEEENIQDYWTLGLPVFIWDLGRFACHTRFDKTLRLYPKDTSWSDILGNPEDYIRVSGRVGKFADTLEIYEGEYSATIDTGFIAVLQNLKKGTPPTYAEIDQYSELAESLFSQGFMPDFPYFPWLLLFKSYELLTALRDENKNANASIIEMALNFQRYIKIFEFFEFADRRVAGVAFYSFYVLGLAFFRVGMLTQCSTTLNHYFELSKHFHRMAVMGREVEDLVADYMEALGDLATNGLTSSE